MVRFFGAIALIGGATVVVMAFIARRVFAVTPESVGQHADGDADATPVVTMASAGVGALPGGLLWRDRAFVSLAAGMAVGLFAQIGLLAHLFSLLVPALGAQAAGLTMGGATACAIVGRTVAARVLSGIDDRRVVAAAGYGIQLLGSLTLLIADAEHTSLILIGVALFGSGIGNATSLPPLIAQVDFASQDVLRVVALIVAIGQGTYALAPALFGLLLAAAGAGEGAVIGAHSVWFFAVAAAIQFAAATCFLIGRR